MKKKLAEGEMVKGENSKFIGFTNTVSELKDIEVLYSKMKLLHSSARHIVCVYRVAGLNKFECKDYCDDGDAGSGRTILNWMSKNNIISRVFFIARYVDNESSNGMEKFDNYLQAAMNALLQDPINSENGRDDVADILEKDLAQTAQKLSPKVNKGRQSPRLSLSDRRGQRQRRMYQKRPVSVTKQKSLPSNRRRRLHKAPGSQDNQTGVWSEQQRDRSERLNLEEWPTVREMNRNCPNST